MNNKKLEVVFNNNIKAALNQELKPFYDEIFKELTKIKAEFEKISIVLNSYGEDVKVINLKLREIENRLGLKH
jgi:hypothetical protein